MPTEHEDEKPSEERQAAVAAMEEHIKELAKQEELAEASEEITHENSYRKTRLQTKAELSSAKKSLSADEFEAFKKYRFAAQAGLKPGVYSKPETYNLTENLEKKFPKFTAGMSDHEKKVVMKRAEKIGEFHKKLQERIEEERRQIRLKDLQDRKLTPDQIYDKEVKYQSLSPAQKSAAMYSATNRRTINVKHRQWRKRRMDRLIASATAPRAAPPELIEVKPEKLPYSEREGVYWPEDKKPYLGDTSASSVSPSVSPPSSPSSPLPQNTPDPEPAPSSETLSREYGPQEEWQYLGYRSKEDFERHLDFLWDMPPLEH